MALRILLDTSAYSDLARGHAPVSERVRRAEALLLSPVVVGELLSGFRTGSRFAGNLADLLSSDDHFQYVEGLAWTSTAAS